MRTTTPPAAADPALTEGAAPPDAEKVPVNLRLMRKATEDELARYAPEDVALLRQTEEDMRKQTEYFSFDEAAFCERMDRGEDWHRVVQAHLYLDHSITALLSDALARPDAIRLSRMGFAQKVELVDAMDLLPPDLIPPVGAVNKLRNRIAHQLNFEPSRSDVRNLKNAIPKRLHDAPFESKAQGGDLSLSDLLKVLVLMVDIMRQRKAFEALKTRQDELSLRMAIDQSRRHKK